MRNKFAARETCFFIGEILTSLVLHHYKLFQIAQQGNLYDWSDEVLVTLRKIDLNVILGQQWFSCFNHFVFAFKFYLFCFCFVLFWLFIFCFLCFFNPLDPMCEKLILVNVFV